MGDIWNFRKPSKERSLQEKLKIKIMAQPTTSVFRLMVRNIGWACTRSDLRAYFGKFGVVHAVNIPMDFKTGFNKRIAFVEMKGDSDAKDVLLKDFHTVEGNEVYISQDTSRKKNKSCPAVLFMIII